MKKYFFISFLNIIFASHGQVTWQNFPGGPTGGFWDMDTMNAKLYVAAGSILEYDGASWTTLNNYNASYSTPNKTKSASRALNGNLYCGAKDFNTSGQGDVHYYNGTGWTLNQNTNFTYNGNYKIRSFASYSNTIYMSGNFIVPTASSYSNIAKWNGTDWVNVGRNFTSWSMANEIFDMEVFQGNLFITEKNNVWKYNGTTWDSLFNTSSYPTGSSINDMVVYNGDLYISGFFNLSSSNMGIVLVKYNGTAFTPVAKAENMNGILSSGTYTTIGKMCTANNNLFFVAKKTADNATYLVSYDGAVFSEKTKLADSGDWTYGPGSEYTNYTKMMLHNGNFIIGGNFLKIGGQTLTGLVYTPFTTLAGVDELYQNTKLSVYPNPSNGMIHFKFDDNKKRNLIITDLFGKMVFTENNISADQMIKLNVPQGVYFYECTLEGKPNARGKIIIN